MQRILDRYIFIQLIPPFILTIGGLFAIFLSRVLLHLVELWIEQGIGLLNLLKVLLHLLPTFLVLTIPIAGIMASISTFSRLSFDKELIAMSGAGLSLYRLSRPVLIFFCLVFGLTLVLAQWGQPWQSSKIQTVILALLRDQLTLSLEEGIFNQPVPGMVFYVGAKENGTDSIPFVFISDHRDPAKPQLIIAHDYFITNQLANNQVMLRLINGTVHLEPTVEKYRQINFSTYDVKLPINPRFIKSPRKRPTKSELFQKLDKTNWRDGGDLKQLMRYYKDLAFPTATLLFGMIGVPLGIVSKRSGRIGCFAVGVAVLTLYFLFDIMSEYLVITLFLHPLAGAWMPNFIFLFLGSYLYFRVSQRNPG